MRIAHVTATFPPYHGGTGNVCYYNARELARRGHEVHVFTTSTSGPPSFEERDGFSVHRLRPVVRVGNAPVLPGLLLSLRGFDVIHLHYPFILGAEMVRVAAQVSRIPIVISFHNDLIGTGVRGKIFSLYQRISAYTTVRTAACLCAVSLDHFQASVLRRSLPPHRPLVIELPNGIDTRHFCPAAKPDTLRDELGIPPDTKLVLFVAALDRAHHFKGLESLLRALQLLPRDMWLLIVGDGDLRRGYHQQAAALGVDDRTRFVGAIGHAELPRYYRCADLTVLPSSPPESFGLVLIESLACGTPVVASDIPGVRTVVENGIDGLLVHPHNAEELAEAIQQVLRDDRTSRAMGLRGRARVEARYSWERIGVRLEAVYEQVLESAQGDHLAQRLRNQ